MRLFYFCFCIVLLPQLSMATDAYDKCRWQFLHGQYFMAEESCLAAAKEGAVDAQNWLALMYTKGKGVPQSFEKAFLWRKKAAQSGDANSQYHLGRLFQRGEGVEKDFQKAELWYRSAAMQGDINGLYNLGRMYTAGIGVEKDVSTAFAWFTLAAERGLDLAENAAGKLQTTMSHEQLQMSALLISELREKIK